MTCSGVRRWRGLSLSWTRHHGGQGVAGDETLMRWWLRLGRYAISIEYPGKPL